MDVEVAHFTDVRITRDPHPSISYRSGLTVYTEALIGGSLVGRGWNGSGFVDPESVRFDPAEDAAPQSFWLEIDGHLLASHWDLAGIETTREGQAVTVAISLVHRVRAVSVVVTTVLDGSPILRRWLDVTNTGEAPAALSVCHPWSGVLLHRTPYEQGAGGAAPLRISVGTMQDARWGREGLFDWTPLGEAGVRVLGRYRRPPHRHPLFVLRSETTGEHFIGQLGWSGGFVFEFDHESYPAGDPVALDRVTFRAGPDAPAPQRIIGPGETVSSPHLHLGMVVGDLDLAVNAMHQHVRASVMPTLAADRVGLIVSGIGPEQSMTEEAILHEVDRAGALGAEAFIIDAGWYAPPDADWHPAVGNWTVGPQFSDQLSAVRTRAHDLGMRFGLWMEPERFGPWSTVALERGEFVASRFDGGSADGHLDLSRPDVLDHVHDQIRRLIQVHEVELFRLDYNVGPLGAGFGNRHGDLLESHWWRYYQNLYRMFAELRAEFPDVVFQNCASGGARTDLGMVQWFEHTWVTDWQVAPRSFSITSGMTIALPPELVDRHIGAGMNDHLRGDLDFQARLSLFGRPSIAWLHPVGAATNPEQDARIAHMLRLYKEHVRPMQGRDLVFHHTPTESERGALGWGVIERASVDRRTSILGCFRTGDAGPSEIVLFPRGIDPARRYAVTLDSVGGSFAMSGAELVSIGIRVRRESALTSELVLLTEQSSL
jgi:alpha-galactosidase